MVGSFNYVIHYDRVLSVIINLLQALISSKQTQTPRNIHIVVFLWLLHEGCDLEGTLTLLLMSTNVYYMVPHNRIILTPLNSDEIFFLINTWDQTFKPEESWFPSGQIVVECLSETANIRWYSGIEGTTSGVWYPFWGFQQPKLLWLCWIFPSW